MPILSLLLLPIAFASISKRAFADAAAKTSTHGRALSHASQMATASVALTSVEGNIYSNQSANLTATVSVAGVGPAPTGSVNFMLGASLLGTAPLTPIDQANSTGTITVIASQLAPGPNSITATYSGDANYAGSTAAPITVTLSGSQVSFGSVSVGTAAPVQTLAYQFSSASTLSAVNILTLGASGFDYTDGGSSTCTTSTFYPAGSSCTVTVAFTPSAPGVRAGGVTLFVQGSNLPLMTWYLSGIGQSGAVTIDPRTQSTIGMLNNNGQGFGAVIDGAGNFYVVDHANSQVIELASGTFAQSTVVASGLLNPTAVALDGAGNLYISDSGNNRVVVVPNENGTLSSGDISPVNISGLGSPRGIAVDGGGNLYVADGPNASLVELPPDGGTLVSIVSGLIDPRGIAVDASGNVYVTSDGAVTEYPSGGGTPIPLGSGYNTPAGVAVDASGTVYVTDTGNAEIVEINAGNAAQLNFPIAGLSTPRGIALDASANVYVSDGTNVIEVNRTQAAPLAFGTINVGSTSASQTLTVSDAGDQKLAISNLAVTSNFIQESSGGADCISSTSLSPGEQCLIAVAFAPLSSGTVNGTLILTDNALNNPSSTQSVPLSGNGNVVATTTTVVASPNPSSYGQSVSLTAIVTPAGSGTATGSVTFTDGTSALGTITLSGGVAMLATSSLNAGSHSIVANYNGDSSFSASNSTALALVVNQAASSLALGSNLNPAVYQQPVTFTATITPRYGGVATGTVTFLNGGTPLGSAGVNGNSAGFTTSTFAVGPQSITATYNGDSNMAGSSSSALAEVVSKATTTSTVVSSANPSAPGKSVSFTVTVSPQFGGTPTGTVALKKGAATLATLTLSGGQVSYTTSSFAQGSSQITAVYRGDSNFTGSTSPALIQVVTKTAQNAQMTPSTTQINFANPDGSPLLSGQTGYAPVTFTIQNGPITFQQTSTLCVSKPGGTDYTSECDDTKMNGGCKGTWQTGNQCTITFSVTNDGDDTRCEVMGPNPAYPDGCEGTIQITVPNSNNIVHINYSYQSANPTPQMKVIPSKLVFPVTQVGSSSPPTMTTEILNSGGVPLTLSGVAVTTGTADFAITSNNCPNSLPAQASCYVTVSFTPIKAGTVSGAISLIDNAGNHPPKTISLSGTGSTQ